VINYDEAIVLRAGIFLPIHWVAKEELLFNNFKIETVSEYLIDTLSRTTNSFCSHQLVSFNFVELRHGWMTSTMR